MSPLKSHGKHAASAHKITEDQSAADQPIQENIESPDAEDALFAGDTVAIEADAPSDADAAFNALHADDPSREDTILITAEPEDGEAAVFQAPPGMIGAEDSSFVAAGLDGIVVKKRRNGLKVAGITLGIIIAVLLIAYIAGAVIFMGRFLPNTKLGSHDVSLKTDQEVTAMLKDLVDDYQLDVLGTGFSYRATSKDLGMSINADEVVSGIHQDQNPWMWPLLVFQGAHDESGRLAITYTRSAYEPALTEALNAYNATAKPPVNATIMFDGTTNKFTVKPEEKGTQLDTAKVLTETAEAIEALSAKLSLDDSDLVQPAVVSTDKKLIEAAEMATGMVSAKLTLVMGGMEVGQVSGDTLSQFITINENYEVVFNEDAMYEWVADLAAGYNTVGTERVFTRADGAEIVVPAGGVYGWEVDSDALMEEIIEGVKAGAVATIDVPCYQTADAYNGPNQRDWGNRYIDVDLTEQYVRFYGEDNSIIWESACISGAPDGEHNTGIGMWYVNNKESPSKLIGYEHGVKIYETTVQYWMAFEYSGIGFHDATWQPSFGGTMYANGYGSHGCVNLPYSAAEELYGIVQIGDVVAVHY